MLLSRHRRADGPSSPVSVGNFVELFDFFIFGLFAAQIGANFFPSTDPVASLLSTFATYGVGFVMRPVGAIVIGALGDRRAARPRSC